jgi:menaquinone-specific isochorismate synthase
MPVAQAALLQPADLSEARDLLVEQIDFWLRSGAPSPSHRSLRIVRLECPIQPADPLLWLSGQTSLQRTYWTDRAQNERLAGLGEAWAISSDSANPYSEVARELQELLKEAPVESRFFGGLRFDPKASHSPEWNDWQAARFVLPEILLEERENHHWLVCQVLRREDPTEERTVLRMLRQRMLGLRLPERSHHDTFHFLHRKHTPDASGWNAQVREGLRCIAAGELQKVVLARSAEFELAERADPVRLLLALREQAPQAFQFCFQLNEKQAFLGITPERLYRRNVGLLESEALASTRPRGLTPEEDLRLAEELRNSAKEQREHLMVLARLEALLEQFCITSERLSYLERLPLRHVQHLRSRVQGRLREGVQDAELLPAFHPTPAVSGTPKRPAAEHIRRLESFDRGWYAGPIGWVSRDAAEFAVALRSGLLTEKCLKVYTGAGIVEGSEPEKEWQELEIKLRTWASVVVPA